MKTKTTALLLFLFLPLYLFSQGSLYDAREWKTQGDEKYEIIQEELDKEMIGGKSDYDRMYSALKEAYYLYVKSDLMAQNLEDNDMGNNIHVQDVAQKLQKIRAYFANAGVYYNEKQEYIKSAEYFEIYADYPFLRIFSDERVDSLQTSEVDAYALYYAAICAIQSNDNKEITRLLERVIAEPYVPNEIYKESDPYELLALNYQNAGDKDAYMNILYKGTSRFPDNLYLASTLINEYMLAENYADAMKFLDNLIERNIGSSDEYITVKATILVQEKKYTEAEKEYKRALQINKQCLRALNGLGVLYAIQAQELNDTDKNQLKKKARKKLNKKIIGLYQKALPYMEEAYAVVQSKDNTPDIRSALYKLQNVYFNMTQLGIDKQKEYDRVTGELDTLR
ncbi:lipopolysaccharide assembly protein LapB [Dysgonomonas sp. 25]|uniref:tetratricopeptide repeat protein n=1 Tax=Dysgonomonas sp. 25 TaxID=2302933 RepID=UPI0013D7F675|nr:hypothetical protein [Dysgonomonas sp. 25]NDV68465.1 hypothetical protein [Dysgonomonas sp. 25]